MKVLVVGSGGREHTLVWKIAQSKKVTKIYAAPGNGGMEQIAECVDIKADDIKGLIGFAEKQKIDFTVVGPEIPLVMGIVDEFQKKGLSVFGPSKKASQLEGSKIFTKELLFKYNIPTADGQVFSSAKKAIDYINNQSYPIVIKADGLAAGKGVIICKDKSQAEGAIRAILDDKVFGEAGERILIEECLKGEEISILAFTDGKTIIPLVPSQDHKRAFDEDKGPNTGGMGAYSPVKLYDEKLAAIIQKDVLEATVNALNAEGIEYKGILYAGLMITSSGPKVLEYNVRFGDPETQVVLPRMESDLLEPMINTANGTLEGTEIKWTDKACVCVVMASGGYPGSYEKGYEIKGLNSVSNVEDSKVFHAGTLCKDGKIVTNGGRVLGVSSLGDCIEGAVSNVYDIVRQLSFQDMFYREDIAKRAGGHKVRPY